MPIGAFAAGCAVSWELTARRQWAVGIRDGNFTYYMEDYYYRGGYDAAAVAEFAVSRTWGLLSWHMPPIVVAAALLAFGWLLWSALRRRRLDAVALLALSAVGIAACAAVIGAYPLGGVRQCLYLGPIVFLAAGSAFHTVVDDVAGLLRRAWVGPALAAGMIALVGAAAIRHYDLRDNLYYSSNNIRQVFAALDEREREGDGVYVYSWAVPLVEFYKGEKPANYFYEQTLCSGSRAATVLDCVPEALDEMFRVLNEARRIWFIHNVQVSVPKEIAAYSQEISVEEIAVEKIATVGWNTLHLITDFGGVAADIREEWLAAYDDVAAEAPSAAGAYKLYSQDGALYYAKRPCDAADTEAPFFLHIYPENADDLPERRRRSGFDNLDFGFLEYGLLADDKCFIRRALPEYAIERIHAGQFVLDGSVAWEAEVWFNSKEWFDMYDDIAAGPPSAAGDYNLYLQDGALYYAKRPCDAADTEARFFLHIYPADADDLPERRRQHGFDNLDFGFHEYGLLADDKCFIRRALPEYAVERIHAGQFVYPDGDVVWEAELAGEP